eukprot:6467446-Amphidinium_carterae.1
MNYEQFLYRDEDGAFLQMTEAETERYNLDGIHVIRCPDRADCSAHGRYCIPCGGSSGEIFPCMICEIGRLWDARMELKEVGCVQVM